MSTVIKDRLPQLPGPGLKKEGIVVLQFLLIGFITFLEITLRKGTGILSGLVLIVATFGAVAYGRPGTRYVSAVTPPLAFASVVLIMTMMHNGIRISRVGVDFMAALASVAPYLLISAIYGWYQFLNEKAKKKPPKKPAPKAPASQARAA
jgi:hypothetical protein